MYYSFENRITQPA